MNWASKCGDLCLCFLKRWPLLQKISKTTLCTISTWFLQYKISPAPMKKKYTDAHGLPRPSNLTLVILVSFLLFFLSKLINLCPPSTPNPDLKNPLVVEESFASCQSTTIRNRIWKFVIAHIDQSMSIRDRIWKLLKSPQWVRGHGGDVIMFIDLWCKSDWILNKIFKETSTKSKLIVLVKLGCDLNTIEKALTIDNFFEDDMIS